ncbi:MAG TPA: membrane protein insertase YidC [Sneathiellales bacterium]|nr:membrane protein insertase YidC [Sneathiellales bacterium]
MSDQKNLIIAVALSIAVIMGFQFFYEMPRMEAEQVRLQALTEAQTLEETSGAETPPVSNAGLTPSVAPIAGNASGVPVLAPGTTKVGPDGALLAAAPRVPISSDNLRGSISMRGGRVDDLALVNYHETIDDQSPEIVLLAPTGTEKPYHAEFGWISAPGANLKLPTRDTLWQTTGSQLSPGSPITFGWDNGAGLLFERTYTLDDNYMFSVRQQVSNRTSTAVTLYPYGLVSRTGTPEVSGFIILHEGALGVFDGELVEEDYEDISEAQSQEHNSTGGWLGFTDKYWLTALIPDQKQRFTGTFNHSLSGQRDRYQVDYRLDAQQIPAGGSVTTLAHFFAGAKEADLLEAYNDNYKITSFDLAIDWGYLRFITQPLFHVLKWLNGLVGNFGVAILLLTVAIKIVFFPLANKSYKSMSMMRKLQPEVVKMKERYGDDRTRMQQEMMALYKKEKVNPMAGCLPIVVQIPVFFALYKVLFVTIEMRHAPFFGWIKDLSAPDPMVFINLFGLIPWDPPQLLAIGIWPLMMGASMFLQQKLNPQPTDPMQAKIFMLMPIMFTFMLGSFPAGLVIYWTWNNVLSITQQWVIMRRMGVKI